MRISGGDCDLDDGGEYADADDDDDGDYADHGIVLPRMIAAVMTWMLALTLR